MAAELERLRMEEKRDTKMRQQIRETRCLFMPVTELLLWKFFFINVPFYAECCDQIRTEHGRKLRAMMCMSL